MERVSVQVGKKHAAAGGYAAEGPKRAPSPLWRVLAALLLYSIYLLLLSRKREAPERASDILDTLFLDFTRRGTFGLLRAPAARHLERKVDADPIVGVCYRQSAMLQPVPDYVCRMLECLWVEDLQLNIDLWAYPLRVLPGPSEFSNRQCPIPHGGQRPVPEGQRPHISFVVTAHNNALATAQCLLELFRTAHEVPSAEYIVVDDGSTEDMAVLAETMQRLQDIFKVRIKHKRNEAAQGYGLANAEGIHMASGNYIALINNDMFVVKGWLSAIMLTFDAYPRAGLVGPLFVGEGDLVTEAGGIIFADAAAANYGRGREPHYSMYYMRPADYISAACVVFPKHLYKKIGGFDPQYEKGYYEDTDLAMSVRAAGYDVLFQPLAVAFHQEGSTFGTDATSDLKRQLMAQNKQKFAEKWRYVLQEKHCPPHVGHSIAHNRPAYPRFLWIDDIVPEPDRDSGSVRNMHLLNILLRAGYAVTFAPTTGGREGRYEAALRHMGVQVFPVMAPEQWMLAEGGVCAFDVIMVARRGVFERAQGQMAAHCPGVPVIYDTVDLHFLREARDAITTPGGHQRSSWRLDSLTTKHVLEWLEVTTPEAERVRRTRDSELYFIDKSTATLVVSPDEVEVLQHYRPRAHVAVVTNIHTLPALAHTKCEARSGTLFVGNLNHIPNRQAIEALITDVLPVVLRVMPSKVLETFRMHIVGSNVLPPSLKKLFEENKNFVTFHGQLSDEKLNDLFGQVRVSVAPLISGAGVKGKVNQAMKMRVPVVATPIAVEGMYAHDGVDCLVADGPEAFAQRIVQLHQDCELWQQLAEGGRRNVREHFSVELAEHVFLEVLTNMGRGPLPEQLRGTCRPLLPKQFQLAADSGSEGQSIERS